jgi:hypothetical protein
MDKQMYCATVHLPNGGEVYSDRFSEEEIGQTRDFYQSVLLNHSNYLTFTMRKDDDSVCVMFPGEFLRNHCFISIDKDGVE